MLAVTATRFDSNDLRQPSSSASSPNPRFHGWTTASAKALTINQHDLSSRRRVNLSEEQLPVIIGYEAAGRDDDGHEVVDQGENLISIGSATRTSTLSGGCCPSRLEARSPTPSPLLGVTAPIGPSNWAHTCRSGSKR